MRQVVPGGNRCSTSLYTIARTAICNKDVLDINGKRQIEVLVASLRGQKIYRPFVPSDDTALVRPSDAVLGPIGRNCN